MFFKFLFSKKPCYEELRRENRRLIVVLSTKDTNEKLVDMINDLYFNWEPFVGRKMYMHLLSELNEFMSAELHGKKDESSIIWNRIQATMKELAIKDRKSK